VQAAKLYVKAAEADNTSIRNDNHLTSELLNELPSPVKRTFQLKKLKEMERYTELRYAQAIENQSIDCFTGDCFLCGSIYVKKEQQPRRRTG